MQLRKSAAKMTALLAILLAAYLAMCLALYFFQRQLLFFPTAEVARPGTQSIIVDTGGAKLKVWVVNPGRENALIYFGGNAENVAYAVDDFSAAFPASTLYLVNYRGYGGSSGTPDEAGLYHDALALYDRIAAEHGRMMVMGRSIGSAVATYLAAERETDKLILVTPFDSAVNVARRLYPLFPVALIVRERYDSLGRAAKITAPTLVIAAGSDEIIPEESTRNLVRAFPPARLRFEILPETGHNTLQLHPDYYRLLTAFVRGEAYERPVPERTAP
jgi:pimeloyl-ACP methyl ester carboxylesterase